MRTPGKHSDASGLNRHQKTIALAFVYAAGLLVGLLTLVVSPYFAYLLPAVLAALALVLVTRLTPSDACDRCGRQFHKGIPEKCPTCGADMGMDRKRYGF